MLNKLKVLVLGGGGREHALAWAAAKSSRVGEVVCAPGNGGMAKAAVAGRSAAIRCVPVAVTDLDAMVDLVHAESPDLTVVGPEVPLALGIVDQLQLRKLRVFGPTQAAAELETSKAFAKEFMRRNGIPTAAYAICGSNEEIARELVRFQVPVVVKADGLAAGKGVVICESHAEATKAAADMFSGSLLGAVAARVVLEEFLTGEELSFFAICDGVHAVALAAAQDHKRVGEGDTGPNTGGMGAYSTDALLPAELNAWLTEHVAQKVVDGMRAKGSPFQGVLFCGIMMTPGQAGAVRPMVLEFNTRFGDPETQALMMRLESDVMEIFDAAVDGTADKLEVRLKPGASVCVIAASGGYPGKYANGRQIEGLEEDAAIATSDAVMVFHSGTAIEAGELVTAGGRVLGVTAAAADLRTALDLAYRRLGTIQFQGMQFRRDIGWRALQ